MSIVVAIDGPAGSGKGTVAREIAKRCNFVYIDTGVTYRCVALAVLKEGIDINEEDKIIKLSSKIDIKFASDGKVYLNEEDVTKEIRTKEVNDIVFLVSKIVEVRENMVNLQRKMASDNNVVMEGRDITTVVFPSAQFKFYLDASIDARANRRFKENMEKGIESSYEEIYENIKTRDYNDTHKDVGALTRTSEQIYIDTTNMTIEEVVNKMIDIIKK